MEKSTLTEQQKTMILELRKEACKFKRLRLVSKHQVPSLHDFCGKRQEQVTHNDDTTNGMGERMLQSTETRNENCFGKVADIVLYEEIVGENIHKLCDEQYSLA